MKIFGFTGTEPFSKTTRVKPAYKIPTLFEPECSRLTQPGLLHRLFFRRRTLYPAELQKHNRHLMYHVYPKM